MALIKCGECGTEMSNKADKCPKCGAPAKKKTSLFTWIIAGFFGLVIISAISSKNTSTPSSQSASSTSNSPAAYTPPKPKWSYGNSTDTVSGKDVKQAVIASNKEMAPLSWTVFSIS